ncbi:MAG TPA: hypothetical protein VH724_04250 [Candidatus Angelobacter sp.]|jgi:hypothetical protein|nr:hypothetical protein [Candidatus Angelobacter sp.]
MNKSAFGRVALFLGAVLTAFLAGCGGLSTRLTPDPSPAPSLAAHGTFVFVTGNESGNEPTDGYRLNPDGTLTAVPGSPFPIAGTLAASGRFLLSASQNSLTSYRVDPATGVPRQAASVAALSFPDAIGADARAVYVAGTTRTFDTVVAGFSVADSGELTPLPGSPYMFQPACDINIDCPLPLFSNLALNSSFLALGVIGFHGAGGITIYPRDNNDALGQPQGAGVEEQGAVALQPPSGNVAFSNDFSAGFVDSYLLDPSGKPTQQAFLTTSFRVMDERIDVTGKFLLVLDSLGAVHVFKIDSATAGLSEIGVSDPAGDGATLIAMDPSGRFVIVAQASNQATPAPPDQITVYSFDPASAAMKKLQSYPVGKLPSSIAIVAE